MPKQKKTKRKAPAKKPKAPKLIHKQFAGLGLNERQQDFVVIYCRPDMCYNATRAYAEAYGLEDIGDYFSAAQCASRLLKNVNIMKAVDIERARHMRNHEKIAEFVLSEWYKMAGADITETLEITGPVVTVRELSEIPQHLRSCIKVIKTTSAGIELQFHDKNKALENLGKALGMFVERKQDVNEEYESLVEKIAKERGE